LKDKNFRYKDFAIRIYENARHVSPKMKVVFGPYVHAMPEDSDRNPGPGFDGKGDMIRWFDHWLKDSNDSDIMDEPDITLFIRTSLTTGFYRYESEWPIPRQKTRRMFLSKGEKLIEKENNNNSEIDILEYRPWIGLEGGIWWGESIGDQRLFDKYCLIYESEIMNETIEIIGFVNVSLQVKFIVLIKSNISFLFL
jgi:predicted acyl esterase